MPRSQEALVFAGDEILVRLPQRAFTKLSGSPATGSILAALMTEARAVVALEKLDPRLGEAATLGARVVAAAERRGDWLGEAISRAAPLPHVSRDEIERLEALDLTSELAHVL